MNSVLKFSFASALLLVAGFHAQPAQALALGDSATYSQVTGGTEDIVKTEVISTNADQFVSVTYVDGSSLSRYTGSISKYEQNLASILPNCVANGGTLEAVNTPAGHFNTCHLSKEGTDVYHSPDVSFGVVKYSIHANGIDTDKILTSFVKH